MSYQAQAFRILLECKYLYFVCLFETGSLHSFDCTGTHCGYNYLHLLYSVRSYNIWDCLFSKLYWTYFKSFICIFVVMGDKNLSSQCYPWTLDPLLSPPHSAGFMCLYIWPLCVCRHVWLCRSDVNTGYLTQSLPVFVFEISSLSKCRAYPLVRLTAAPALGLLASVIAAGIAVGCWRCGFRFWGLPSRHSTD